MNKFGYRHVRTGTMFAAEYRLAHWAGFRIVRDSTGEPALFSHAMDAELAAACELVRELNGNAAFWRGPNRNDARAAAEKLFTRAANGQEG